MISRFLGVSIDYIVGNDFAPDATEINPYEASLLHAAREADDRAKEDALEMLLMHKL